MFEPGPEFQEGPGHANICGQRVPGRRNSKAKAMSRERDGSVGASGRRPRRLQRGECGKRGLGWHWEEWWGQAV